MFHRRRQLSNPALNLSPDPSAATAAAQAFLSSRASSQSLSSFAAAAALRAHTTSPTPVSEVQTKRTLRRQASTSSNGSAAGNLRGSAGRGPQRRTSSGSMTGRTFRDASPIRGVGRGRSRDTAPVPAIPDTLPDPGVSRRVASLEPVQVSSSSSKGVTGRGVSLDRTEGQASHTALVSNLDPVVERDSDHIDDGGSVNFSYPIKGLKSPKLVPLDGPRLVLGRRPASPLADGPSATRGLSGGEVANTQYSVRETVDRPVKREKKAVAKEIAQGSYLADGARATGGRHRGTVVDKKNYEVDIDSNYQPMIARQDERPTTDASTASAATTVPRKKKKKKKKIGPSAEEPRESQDLNVEYPSPITSHSSGLDSSPEATGSTRRGQRSRRARVGDQLVDQPSIVLKDREREKQGGGKRLESSIWAPGGLHGALEASDSRWKAPPVEDRPNPQDYSEYPSSVVTLPIPTTATSPGRGLEPGPRPDGHVGSREDRPPSLNPSRTAHFSTTPILSTNIGQLKHEPLPRAVSPAKSAMKPSPSSRTGSPMGSLFGRSHGHKPAEASDENSLRSEDGDAGYLRGTSKGRKKARVSFDEESVVVGRAATPPTSPDSPVEKNDWYSQEGREDRGDATSEGVSDKGIKPVPALPTFGSVYARRKRAGGEEDVEKVTESVPGAPSATGSGSSIGNQMGAPSDMALGAIIAHDLASKEALAPPSLGRGDPELDQLSHKQTDPLPPLVTSVEGTGWASDSEVSDDNEPRILAESLSGDPSGRAINGQPVDRGSSETSYVKTNEMNGKIPQVVLVEPTPSLEATVDREEWLNIPGTFPTRTGTQTPEEQDVKNIVEHHATDLTPASLGISEPEPEEAMSYHHTGSPTIGEFAASLNSHIQARSEDDSDSSGDSIYSDAAEDLSDLEGDGFGSIDAVVESPTIDNVIRLPITSSIQSPTATKPNVATSLSNQPSRRKTEDYAESPSDESEDRAQVHQQGLRAQKWRQVEQAVVPRVPSGSAISKTRKPSMKKPQPKRVLPKAHRWMESESGYSPDPPATNRTPRESGAEPMVVGGVKKLKRDLVTNPNSGTEPQHPRGLLQKRHVRNSAPVSAAPPSTPAEGGIHQRSMSENAAPPHLPPPVVSTPPKRTGKMAALRRTLSNESDSDSGSSFKRRPRETSRGPGSHLRKTLRSPPPGPEASSTVGSGTRPLSPSGRKPFTRSGAMRSTMRDSSIRTPSPLPNSPERTRSPIRFSGFGKSSKQKTTALQPAQSSFASRFSGSAKPAFKSRFADSSDEDEGVSIPLTPVRGIPRVPGVESRESTELSDSSDYDDNVATRSAPPRQSGRFLEGNGLASSRLRHNGSGRDLSTSTRHTEHPKSAQKTDKKRLTFGSLSRHKRDTTSKVRKSDIESAARRDTPLERSKLELRASRAVATASTNNGTPIVSRKKNMFRHFSMDSWLLRGHHSGGGETAVGADEVVAAAQRPRTEGEGREESSSLDSAVDEAPEEGERRGDGSEGESVVRKERKKFLFLRRVFRLDGS